MRKLSAIAVNDLRVVFSEKGVWLNVVIIPLLIAFVVGLANGAFSNGVAPAPTVLVDILNQDDGPQADAFLDAVRRANEHIVLCPFDNNADDVCELAGGELTPERADARLREQVSLAVIEIPAGFSQRLSSGEDVQLVYRSNESAVAPSFILQAVQSATTRLSGVVVAQRVGEQVLRSVFDLTTPAEAPQQIAERAAALWQNPPAAVAFVQGAGQGQQRSADNGGFSQSVPGIATMYVMFAVFPAMSAFMIERKNWTFQRMVTLPLTRAQILGGKLLARFLLGMIQYAIIFAFGFLLGVRYGSDPVALILVMIAYTLCITALTLALTTLLRTEGQAEGLTLFLTLTLAPLGGAWWPLEIVPEWMRVVGHLSPVAWAMDAYHTLIFFDGNLSDVLGPVAVLLAAAGVLFLFGVSRFQYE